MPTLERYNKNNFKIRLKFKGIETQNTIEEKIIKTLVNM